jgi:hypothetical protein
MRLLLLPLALLALLIAWLLEEWRHRRQYGPIERYAARHGLTFTDAERHLTRYPEEIDR